MSIDNKTIRKPHEDNTRLVPHEEQHITIERLRDRLPRGVSTKVTQEMVDLIHAAEDDTGLPQELVEEDFMSYMHLVGSKRGASIVDLLSAVKYCNLKRNMSNKEAWAIVFPDKFNALVAANKQVDNHVSMYNGRDMVATIDKELLIPVSMQYAPYFHAAVKKQFEIMNGKASKDIHGKEQSVSAMVQHLAAKELATLTAPVEDAKLSVTVTPGSEVLSAQQEMNEQLKAIVSMQRNRLTAGEDITDVQVIGMDFNSDKEQA